MASKYEFNTLFKMVILFKVSFTLLKISPQFYIQHNLYILYNILPKRALFFTMQSQSVTMQIMKIVLLIKCYKISVEKSICCQHTVCYITYTLFAVMHMNYPMFYFAPIEDNTQHRGLPCRNPERKKTVVCNSGHRLCSGGCTPLAKTL